MTGADIMDIGRDAIMTLLYTAGPIMVVALGVGLVIALFQALTQIQEMTLTFVPKIVVIFLMLMLMMPYMGSTIGGFMERMAERISGG